MSCGPPRKGPRLPAGLDGDPRSGKSEGARPGRVYLVGAGPGDPELLTLRAARLLAEADDVVVDALVPAALYKDLGARIVYVGKRAGRPRISQSKIHDVLVELARSGRRVVRLKGGDPGVFGRVGEEMRALEAAGVPYELVPGVSSALAAPAAVGLSLTDREHADRVLILTGRRRQEDRAPLPELPPYDPRQTVVLLMALGSLESLVVRALAAGYPSQLPCAVISRATLPAQSFIADRLEVLPQAVARAGLEAPATVVFGEIARRLLSSAEPAAVLARLSLPDPA